MISDKFKQYCTDGFIRFLFRHIVPLSFTYLKNREEHEFLVMSIVLSVFDKWYLITAGHCLKEIEELETRLGYKYLRSFFVDNMNINAKHIDPVPFDYKTLRHSYVDEPNSYDYGIIIVDYLSRRNLEANGIAALDENAWRRDSDPFDFFTLLGIPKELTRYDPQFLNISSLLLNVEPLNNKPDGFPDTILPIFYGKVDLALRVNSIEGMSGSPIFGLRKNEMGQLKYWLIAVQSGWIPTTQHISACPVNYLAECLSELFND
ncbi:MAG: hypothetical protein ABSF80_06025 [Chitinispirillaceae bacterium]|jgi:hypothetical protein